MSLYNALSVSVASVVDEVVLTVSKKIENNIENINQSNLNKDYIRLSIISGIVKDTRLQEILDREIQKYLDLQRDNK
jgi:hypothetical protein